jgi:hypothetical protein
MTTVDNTFETIDISSTAAPLRAGLMIIFRYS